MTEYQYVTFKDQRYKVDMEHGRMWVLRKRGAHHMPIEREISWIGPTAFAVRKLMDATNGLETTKGEMGHG